MAIDMKAVVYGFIVSLLIGLIGGAVVPGTGMTVPVMGWGLAGIVAGLVAGYVAGGTVGNGAVHGGLATVIGALVLLVAVAFVETLFGGLVPAFGLLTVGVTLLVIYAIPGAIGGAIGSWSKNRRATRQARPAA
ncbi:DUF5518 domain-containing protein [Halalkalicoccus jeotgali]|nr:DUF5518 domain-containing protein [Halalkalicoccus jeotgali]